MATHTLKVHGMHCASCASIIQKKVSGVPGVTGVSVNYANEKATVELDREVPLAELNKSIEPLGYALYDEKAGEHTGHVMATTSELEDLRRKVEFTLPVTVIVFVLMMWDIASRLFVPVPNLPIPMELFNIVMMVLAVPVLFWAGSQFIQGVGRFVRHGAANMDTLIGIGTLTAFIYSSAIVLLPIRSIISVPEFTFFDVTIVVVGFVLLGKYLEARSKERTGDAIKELLNLQAKTALVERGGEEIEIPVSDVLHGDLIIVKPATKIPVDGIVVNGSSYVDEALVTGEPMPVLKQEGDTVVAGTINTSGSFVFKATKVGSETLLSQIIRMVEEAQGSRAPIQALADKISGVFVPIVLGLAVLSFVSWLVFGPAVLGFSQSLSIAITSFVGILVIACPCALGLATPTAIIVGVGKGAKEGILIKDAATLQKLHKVDTVLVDKTGTITKGKPELVSIENRSNDSDDHLISLLASLEKRSEHPIAEAILAYARDRQIELRDAEMFNAIKGKGVEGSIGGEIYYAGNHKLIADLGIPFDAAAIEREAREGKTPVILATRTEVLAIVFVADALKPEAQEAVKKLHALGIRVVMLTGDNRNTAETIARSVGIDEVVADVMPEDKLEKVKQLQKEGRIVAMAGDGVNDAPALAQADVGIAMATGTDVAIESAGITLLHGDISKLVKAIHLSRLTMRGIKQNLFWAFIYNIVGIPLAGGALYPVFGWLLNPVFAGLAMAFSSVSVVGNSLRLKTKSL